MRSGSSCPSPLFLEQFPHLVPRARIESIRRLVEQTGTPDRAYRSRAIPSRCFIPREQSLPPREFVFSVRSVRASASADQIADGVRTGMWYAAGE
jgi:hypothetical protein